MNSRNLRGLAKLERYALYLHDYGSQIGLRLALRAPERVAVLIIQNCEINERQVARIRSDLWKLHWPLMNTPVRHSAPR